MHATVQPGERLSLPWNPTYNALAYVLAGRGTVGADGRPITEGDLAVLDGGDRVSFTSDTAQDGNRAALELLLLGGQPIREPVFQYGPFVMNTRAEILQALDDYNSGRLGQVPAGAIRPYDGRSGR